MNPQDNQSDELDKILIPFRRMDKVKEDLEAYVTTRVKEAEQETLDMAYDTIISYGYMRSDGLYMNGGFSTQELAFSYMRKIGALDRNGLFDPQKYMKYLDDLTTTTNGKEE